MVFVSECGGFHGWLVLDVEGGCVLNGMEGFEGGKCQCQMPFCLFPIYPLVEKFLRYPDRFPATPHSTTHSPSPHQNLHPKYQNPCSHPSHAAHPTISNKPYEKVKPLSSPTLPLKIMPPGHHVTPRTPLPISTARSAPTSSVPSFHTSVTSAWPGKPRYCMMTRTLVRSATEFRGVICIGTALTSSNWTVSFEVIDVVGVFDFVRQDETLGRFS